MSEWIRLLVCRDCATIEEVPDYEGPPENDNLLEHLLTSHRFPNHEPHKGNLLRVEKKWWALPSAKKQIMEELGLTQGLGGEWYASKKTFEEDAMKCFNRHGRPQLAVGCNDYCSDKKRLGNPTKIGWQVGPKVYLCKFCPYETEVKTEKRWTAGMYKEN